MIKLDCIPSTTITVKSHEALLFDPSTKVYETLVEPTSKLSPEVCVASANLTKPDISLADGSSQKTWTRDVPASIVLRTSDGQLVRSGDVVSTVFMYN